MLSPKSQALLVELFAQLDAQRAEQKRQDERKQASGLSATNSVVLAELLATVAIRNAPGRSLHREWCAAQLEALGFMARHRDEVNLSKPRLSADRLVSLSKERALTAADIDAELKRMARARQMSERVEAVCLANDVLLGKLVICG